MRAFKIVESNKRITKQNDGAGSFPLSIVLKIKSKAAKAHLHLPLFTSPALPLVTFHLELSAPAMKNLRIKVGRGPLAPWSSGSFSPKHDLFFATSFMSLTQLTPAPSQVTSYYHLEASPAPTNPGEVPLFVLHFLLQEHLSPCVASLLLPLHQTMSSWRAGITSCSPWIIESSTVGPVHST